MIQQHKVSLFHFISLAGKGLEQYVPLLTQSKKDYYQVNMLDCNTND